MEKEFVPYELALRIKAIGFDEPCLATFVKSEFLGYPEPTFCFSNQVNIEKGVTKNTSAFISIDGCASAPTWNQVFMWFDENTDYSGFIISSIKENFFDWEIRNCDMLELESDECYPTRGEANMACIEKLCEILEYSRK